MNFQNSAYNLIQFTLAGFDATSGNVQLVVEYLHDDGYDRALGADMSADPNLDVSFPKTLKKLFLSEVYY